MLFLTAIASFDRLFEALAQLQPGTVRGKRKRTVVDTIRLIIPRVVNAPSDSKKSFRDRRAHVLR
jgi:hypothetical protein